MNAGVEIWGFFVGLVSVFIYCFNAEFIVKYLTGIGDMVYHQAEWYKYRNDLQKDLILIIRRSQVPFAFNGLKIIDCNLKNFGSVSVLHSVILSFFFKK